MPSSIGHALVARVIGGAILSEQTPRSLWVTGIIAAVIPDIDAIGRPVGLGDLEALGGHRALTHSIPFAVVAGLVLATMARAMCKRHPPPWARLALFYSLALASHGILDLFATYGSGVCLWCPLSKTRYVGSWRILSPLSELWYLWAPSVLLAWLIHKYRQKASRAAPTA